MLDLKKIATVLEASTPGPWIYQDDHWIYSSYDYGQNIFVANGSNKDNNAEFICTSREVMPALLDEVERLRKQAKTYKNENDLLRFSLNAAEGLLKHAEEAQDHYVDVLRERIAYHRSCTEKAIRERNEAMAKIKEGEVNE